MDELLLPFLRATGESERQQHLDELLLLHAAPIVRVTLRHRLGFSVSQTGTNPYNQGAQDLYQDIMLRIVQALNDLKSSPEKREIKDFRKYARLVATNVSRDYLRSKSPARRRLKDKIRLLLTRHPDVRSFLGFARQIEPQLRVRYGPAARESQHQTISWTTWWHSLAWKPVYAAAAVVIGVALMIGVALLLKRRAANLEAHQNQPPQINIGSPAQTPTPENRAATNALPTPAPLPSVQLPRQAPSPSLTLKNREPLKPVENTGVVAALNDGTAAVTVDRVGNVSGLGEVPENQRQAIGEALVAQNFKEPAIDVELVGAPIHLRGPSEGPTFRLLLPKRTVIITDRPTFEWQRLAGATSYKVLIGDLKGHAVATSEVLSSNQTTWTLPTPVKRGEIYSWGVEAIVDGKKIYSPGTTETERKFKVLSESSVRELEQIKQARSHLALGVFYANEGMLAEAEHEFQILVRDNHRVPVLKKLLTQIQLWSKE